MKICFLFLAEFISSVAFNQTIGLAAGKNLIPGEYFSVGYEHYSNSAINGRIDLFQEKSSYNGLHYSAYGFDLMGEYASNQNEQTVFVLRLGLGASGQIESEPWIYSTFPFSKKLNYGLVGTATGEWWMSDHFCLSAFVQQKFLLNNTLGNTRFAFGLGLKFHIDNN